LIRWPLQTRPSKQKQINTQGLTEDKLIEKSQTQKDKSKSRQKNIEDFFLNKYWTESAAIVISALNVLCAKFSSLYAHLFTEKRKTLRLCESFYLCTCKLSDQDYLNIKNDSLIIFIKFGLAKTYGCMRYLF